MSTDYLEPHRENPYEDEDEPGWGDEAERKMQERELEARIDQMEADEQRLRIEHGW